MVRDLKNLNFTPDAISIMFREAMLVFDAQRKKDSKGSSDLKLLPLWTIAIPSILKTIKDKKFISKKPIVPAKQAWDPHYLQDVLHKIRESLAPYISFGKKSPRGYGYELLLMCNDSYALSPSSFYPLGVIYAGPMNNIKFLPVIDFTETEIEFFQQILKGTLDTIILKNLQITESEEVLKSFRLVVCNQLATELIISKLIIYINNYARDIHNFGDLKFSIEESTILLEKCTEMYQVQNQVFLNANKRSHFLQDYDFFLRPLDQLEYGCPSPKEGSDEEDFVLVERSEVDKAKPTEVAHTDEEDFALVERLLEDKAQLTKTNHSSSFKTGLNLFSHKSVESSTTASSPGSEFKSNF